MHIRNEKCKYDFTQQHRGWKKKKRKKARKKKLYLAVSAANRVTDLEFSKEGSAQSKLKGKEEVMTIFYRSIQPFRNTVAFRTLLT